MAESIAAIIVQQLSNLIDVARKHSEGGVREDLEFIKGEFERMTIFLRVADAVQDNDPEVAVWVKQVREIAHDAQDVLNEYDLLFSSQREHVQRIFSFIKNCRRRSRLATELHSIKFRVHEVSQGHQRYSIRYENQEQTWRSGMGNYSDVGDVREAAHLQDEADLVGIQRRKGELISKLLDGDSKFKVISVVGMGGLGKTTLVKKVYEDKDLKSQFQSHAWITVSATYNIKDLLKSMIEQFFRSKKEPLPQLVESMGSNDLREFVKDFFKGRKYLIVLDDVWDINLWDAMKYALCNGSSQSRVMFTTRSKDVAFASSIDSTCIYELKLLSPEESWELFCNKAFKGENCPSHLKVISERILSKCEGLPLAIVTIGGILALKDKGRIDDWELIYRGIGVELEGEGMLDKMKRILLLSFFNLPHQLKVCLQYLSIFPEDHEISCNQVIRLWIAEGFIEEREGLTMEEVGQSYVNKLVNASLLQVVETTLDGRLRTCSVHDILREIIVVMSKRENLATVAGEKAKRWPSKVRRLAIHGPMENEEDNKIFKHLHSLVLFSAEDIPPPPILSKMLFGGSRILKVLDLGGAQLEVIPEEVFKLYLLEHLSMRSSNVKVVPKSIGNLRKLETLDLKDTFVTELPIEILNLQRLRYLVVHHYKNWSMNLSLSLVHTFRAPYKIGCLVSLQKLYYIDASEKDGVKTVKEIGKLTQLRRLGIEKLRKEDGKDLCYSLERLTNLRSLQVGSIGDDEILDVQFNKCSNPNLLRSLMLEGRLEKIPEWITSLQCLTRLTLRGSRLKIEPLTYLEDLPNLVELALLFNSYEGEELHFKAEKFQRLKLLILESLKGLRRVRIEKGSMRRLEYLQIGHSELMEELPTGIEHLSNLQTIHLSELAENLVLSLQNQQDRNTRAKILVEHLSNDGRYLWRPG